MKYGSDKVAFFLIDGYDLLGVTTTFSEDREAQFEDTTVLGTSWDASEPVNLKKAVLGQNGFFDDQSNGVNAALVGNNVGGTRLVAYGVEGNAKGKAAVILSGAVEGIYKRATSRGELHKASAEYKVTGQVWDGLILHERATETLATGNTDAQGVDTGSSAGSVMFAVHLINLVLGGYSHITFAIRHSADNISFADKASIVNLPSAPIASALIGLTSVNRYVSCRWLFNGAGSGQQVQFVLVAARY